MAAVRYKVAVEGYPRFKHFHDRLSSISSRLENLEAVGNFASCISMGKEMFDNIMKAAKQLLQQDIHLTIVTNGVGIPLPDKLVSKLRVGDTEAKMSWENIQEKGIEDDIKSLSKFQPHFVIFLAKSSMSEMREKNKHLLDKIHGNPENVVVHDMTSDITYSYPELVDSMLKKQAEDLKEILKTVGLKIQYMLEDRAVEILENIVDFNRNFAPGDGQDMDLTISLECSQQVRENFDNEHIISDLDPKKNGVARRKIEAKEKMTSKEKQAIVVLQPTEIQTVLRRCQVTLVVNLIPSPVLDEFLSKQIISSDSYRDIQAIATKSGQNREIIELVEKSGWSAYEAFKQCLQQSKQLDLHERLILEEKKLNIPEERRSTIQEAGTSATDQEAMETDGEPFDPQQKQQLTEEELENIFYEKYIEFLCMKTKCITCDHLAQKFGISGSLVNEFLNEGYFSYEESYRKAVETMRKLRWSQVKKCREGSMVQYDYVMRQTSFLREAEEYVQKMVKLLAEFGKMNFEIYGLLRHTVVPVGLEMPIYPAVSREMSDDLLGLHEVAGCGTIYGKLTIHLKKGQHLINHELKENIRKILIDYRFPQSFRLQELLETRSHAAGRDYSVRAGDELQARMTDEEYERLKKEKGEKVLKVKPGTLGCFIGLREKEKDAEGMIDKASDDGEEMKNVGAGDTESNKKRGAHLYGITCAHCVTGCHPDIQVRQATGNQLRDFGKTGFLRYDGEKIDIAAIRVTMNRRDCNSDLPMPKWDFYTGKAGDLHLVADVVYKHGAVSNTTEGIVISNDYRLDLRDNLRDYLMERANASKSCNFDQDFNILIDIKAAEGAERQVFGASDEDVIMQQSTDDEGQNEENQTVYSRVLEAPRFTIPLPESPPPVKAGVFTKMECTVEGNPTPKVAWYRGDKQLTNHKDFLIQTEGDLHRLIILKTYLEDGVSYKAVATNSAGKAESVCQLRVEKPTFSEPGDSGSVVYYKSLEKPGNGKYRLASLLGGSIVLNHPVEGTFECSYSSHLKNSLDALCDENNLEIVMPWDVPSN